MRRVGFLLILVGWCATPVEALKTKKVCKQFATTLRLVRHASSALFGVAELSEVIRSLTADIAVCAAIICSKEHVLGDGQGAFLNLSAAT